MLFLDRQLRVRTFTPKMSELYHLLPSDTGLSILDIRAKHDYDALEADVAEGLKSLQPLEHRVRTGVPYYIMRVLPYQTVEDKVDGAVVTFTDVTNTDGSGWWSIACGRPSSSALMSWIPCSRDCRWALLFAKTWRVALCASIVRARVSSARRRAHSYQAMMR